MSATPGHVRGAPAPLERGGAWIVVLMSLGLLTMLLPLFWMLGTSLRETGAGLGGLADLFPRSDAQPSVEAIIERMLMVQAVEAARCVDAGVLRAHEDADVGAILGWGFAPYTGGPLSYIDRIGVAAFVKRADELAQQCGERFSPPEVLRSMAQSGERFYG